MSKENGYDTEEGGYSTEDALPAPNPEGNAGACPPTLLFYRIYPELDFNDLFGQPPANFNP